VLSLLLLLFDFDFLFLYFDFMETKRYHITVSGRVQGVGFRFFTFNAAMRLKLAGWVRNIPGGGVELEAEGPQDAVDALIEKLRQGSPISRVTDVDVYEMAVAGGGAGGFEIRH
jgi:acylphosphatase